MSFIAETNRTPTSLLLTPPILPILKREKNIHKVSFRLTPHIKERTPSVLSNYTNSNEWQVDIKQVILESNLISFNKAMEFVKMRAAQDESNNGQLISSSSYYSPRLITNSEPNRNKIVRKIKSRNSQQSLVIPNDHSKRKSAREKKSHENDEIKKLNLKIKFREEKRLKELDEENRKRQEREALLEKDRKNRELLQKKTDEERKKKEQIELNRIKLELEKEKKLESEKEKKIAEIKVKNRARLEAKQANQLFNIDYTKDRQEIKVKY